MSKRHQSSRRKTYGRRLHEVRERTDRQPHHEGFESEQEEWGPTSQTDPLTFLDPRSPRLRYLAAD
jgi:hypothetical protein